MLPSFRFVKCLDVYACKRRMPYVSTINILSLCLFCLLLGSLLYAIVCIVYTILLLYCIAVRPHCSFCVPFYTFTNKYPSSSAHLFIRFHRSHCQSRCRYSRCRYLLLHTFQYATKQYQTYTSNNITRYRCAWFDGIYIR